MPNGNNKILSGLGIFTFLCSYSLRYNNPQLGKTRLWGMIDLMLKQVGSFFFKLCPRIDVLFKIRWFINMTKNL